MADASNNQPQDKTPTETVSLPPQSSPQDTSNWDDRPFSTPGGRVVIETFQVNDHDKVVAE